MKRTFSRNVFAIAFALGLVAPAMAAEVPMAVHPGAKSGGPERVEFLLPASAAREVNLGFPDALRAKSAGPKSEAPPNRVGVSRRADLDALPAQRLVPAWTEVAGGFVARFTVRSEGALRLRVSVVVPSADDGMEIRFAPAGQADAQVLTANWIRETHGANPGQVWTPSTLGDTQALELFVPGSRRPTGDTGLVHDVSHLFADPFVPASAAGQAKLLECHVNYSCSTNTDQLNAGRAVAQMTYTKSDGNSYVCSGSLINDTGGVRRYFATAHHCISASNEAASLQLGWFFEQPCGGTGNVPGFTTSQGARLLRANFENDFTLLEITGTIPAGTALLGWSTTPMPSGTATFGIHHPAGARKALSNGSSTGKIAVSFGEGANVYRVSANRILWQSGITEGGSSGSPILSGAGTLRGTLSAGPRNQSCSGTRESYYSDFSLAFPLVQQWLSPSAAAADDYPNTATAAVATTAYDNAFLKVRLETGTDQDWFKFTFPQAGVWIVYTTPEPGQAAVDTFGRIYASDGTTLLIDNDDDPAGAFGTNFAFYLNVSAPGTFYLQVSGFQGATGSFELNSIYDPSDDHSDLAFLGTSIALGQSRSGVIEAGGDSDYFILDMAQAGALTLASSGSTDVVGVLRNAQQQVVAFNDDASASERNFRLSANVSAGRYYLQVAGFDVQTTGAYSVTASLASSAGPNYTGLWWIPAESGWGINTNHQGDVLFATLFTYATDGEALWLVASNLARQPDGSFTGQLFRTRGPAYFSAPWNPSAVTATPVGTMTWRFSGTTSAQLVYTYEGRTVTKSVVRQDFASPVPTCSPTTASRASETNYQDLWWGGASESGWGINFTHQGTAIFGTLFNYDGAGRDLWLFSAMTRQGDGSFNGLMYYAQGPAYFTLPWTPIRTTEVGAMTFRPTSGDRGTLTYNVGATQVVKSVSRQDFGLANRPVCR